MNKKLFSNSFVNVSMLVVKFAIAFIMTPIYIHSLGNHDYGIWEMGVSLVGYMGLLQLGIPPAIVRYVANYKALDDKASLDRLFSTALGILASIGTICFLLLAALAIMFPEILLEDDKHSLKYTYYILIMALQVLIVFIGMLFQSYLEGYQRYYLTNMVTAINSIIGAVILYFLLTRGYGLIALAAVNTIGLALKFLTYQHILRMDRFGKFRFHLRHVDKKSARFLFGFGAKSFILGISGRISNSTAPLIIGAFLSPATVPLFTIPAGLVRRMNSVVQAITLGFMPYFSELNARKASEQTLQTFLDASRFITALVFCGFLGIGFLGLPFIARWVGPSYSERGELVFYLIAISFLWPMINPLHGRVLTSMGRHGKLAKVRIWDALVNLCLSLLLVQFFGIEGVALAAVIARLIFEPFVLGLVARHLEFKMWRYFREVLAPLIPPILAGGATYYFMIRMIEPLTYRAILLHGAVGSLIYLAVFFFFSVSKAERQGILSVIKSSILPKMRLNLS